MREWIERQNDPDTPPWRTIRFWLSLAAVVAALIVLTVTR